MCNTTVIGRVFKNKQSNRIVEVYDSTDEGLVFFRLGVICFGETCSEEVGLETIDIFIEEWTPIGYEMHYSFLKDVA